MERREESNSGANLSSTQVRLKFLPGPLGPEDAHSRNTAPAACLAKTKPAVTSSERVLTIILAGLRDPERRPRGGRETAGRRVLLGTQAGSYPPSESPAPGSPGPQRPALSEGHLGTQAGSYPPSGLHLGPPRPQRPGAGRGYLGTAPRRVLRSPVPDGGAVTLTGSPRPPRPPDPKEHPARHAPPQPPAARLARRPVPRPQHPETYLSAAGAGWARTEAPGVNTPPRGAGRAAPG